LIQINLKMEVESPEKRTILTRECTVAETIWRDIVRIEETHDESPMKPWIINNAQIVLLYTLKKNSFVVGNSCGTGIVIARLPTKQHTLIQWSAPLFINIAAKSFGLSFGKQSTSTFAVANALTAKNAFTASNERRFKGLDFNFSAGSSLRERSDVISNNLSDSNNIGLLGVSKTSGVTFDLSFFVSGAMTVDTAKCHTVYGTSVTPAQILAMPGPAEFQPFYGELSRVVSTVERPSPFNPGRTSASLERFSAGYDPERVILTHDGGVVREDFRGPPRA
jgi:lipid-binding SYLF domain-containing protein